MEAAVIEQSGKAISMYQVVMILMLSIGLNNHVIIIPLLLHAAGRDAWFASLLSALPIAFMVIFLQYVLNITKQKRIGVWLRERISSFSTKSLLFVLAVPLFFEAVITLRDTTYWAKLSFLETTPHVAILISLAAVCLYAAYAGLGSIAVISGMLLPLVVFFGLFVMTANFPHKDISLLFPLMENGLTPVLKGVLYTLSGLLEVFCLLAMQHYIKGKIRYWMLVVTVLLLTELVTGPTYGIISEFGIAEAMNLRYPPFEEWRIVTLGYHWSNVDFLAIFQWMAGALIRISLSLFLVVDLFGITSPPKRLWWLVVLFTIASLIALLPISDMQFFDLLYKLIVPGQFIWWMAIGCLIPLIVWGLSRKRVQMK